MNENIHKEIADNLKKEKGFIDLIGIGYEKEEKIWKCCCGNIKKYREIINKALDEWNQEKENKGHLEHKYYYDDYLNRQIAPFVIRKYYIH